MNKDKTILYLALGVLVFFTSSAVMAVLLYFSISGATFKEKETTKLYKEQAIKFQNYSKAIEEKYKSKIDSLVKAYENVGIPKKPVPVKTSHGVVGTDAAELSGILNDYFRR